MQLFAQKSNIYTPETSDISHILLFCSEKHARGCYLNYFKQNGVCLARVFVILPEIMFFHTFLFVSRETIYFFARFLLVSRETMLFLIIPL